MLLIQKSTNLVQCLDCNIYRNKYNFIQLGAGIPNICNDCHDKRDEIETQFDECPVCYCKFTYSNRTSLRDIQPLDYSTCKHSICKTCFIHAFMDNYLSGDYDKIRCALCRESWNDLAKVYWKQDDYKKISDYNRALFNQTNPDDFDTVEEYEEYLRENFLQII